MEVDTEEEPVRDFVFHQGIHLSNSVLWCDSDKKGELCFLSHAHLSHFGKHRRILTTAQTLKLITRGIGKSDALTPPYRQPFTLGSLQLTLLPAGHILGSSQLLIEREGKKLLYSHDLNPRRSKTCERAEAVKCDALVVPATYGLPMFRFPPRDEVIEDIHDFLERSYADHVTPVLFVNAMGTAQELLLELTARSHIIRIHKSIWDVCKIYQDFGFDYSFTKKFKGTASRSEVVLCPPILRQHASIRALGPIRTALISGRIREPGYLTLQRLDAGFALSDTADHFDLLDYIQATGAKEVYLSSGYVDAFSEVLRNTLGIKVLRLIEAEQLDLFG